MLYPRIFIISSLLAIFLTLNLSAKPRELDQLIVKIISYGQLQSEKIGTASAKSDQWKRFIEFSRISNDEEIMEFVSHWHPIIRAYAFQALARANNENVVHLFTTKVIYDSAKFDFMINASSGSISVGEYCFLLLTDNDVDPDSYKLSKREKNLLDIMLLYNPELLPEMQPSLHRRLVPKEIYYEQISDLLLKHHKSFAAISLAKYKIRSCLKHISQLLRYSTDVDVCYGLEAAIIFPDSSLLPDLFLLKQKIAGEPPETNHQKIRLFYKAMARNGNVETAKFFSEIAASENKIIVQIHKPYLWLALHHFPKPLYKEIYNGLKLNIWEQHELKYWIEHPEVN